MSNETEWFSGEFQEPNKPGLYQRQIPGIEGLMFSKWEAGVWYLHSRIPKEAHKTKVKSSYQNVPWRGLLNEQKTRREPRAKQFSEQKPPREKVKLTVPPDGWYGQKLR
jgi:hypothetical protein